MKKIIVSCFMLGTLPAVADVVNSTIHSVEKVNSNYLVKFENGRVAFVSSQNKMLGGQYLKDLKGAKVKAKLSSDYSLLSLQSIESNVEGFKSAQSYEIAEPPVYEPTLIPNLAEAQKIFKRLNPYYKRASECSNRAHVWASEEFKKNNIKSMKVFALFTASYIDRVRFKWWFHVAPMLIVAEGATTERRVLDYMFTHQPVTVKEWTDQFVFSKRPCLPTTRFSEYDVNPQTEDCYLMDGPMYDWTPTDLSNREQSRYKNDFSQGDIRAAYSEAF